MTKSRAKKTFLVSVLALILCVATLVGTTFAWFSDSVTSTGNKIVAGTLKIDLELLDPTTKQWESLKESNAPIFNYDNWEPGYVDAKVLKVENEGSLSLKWKAKFISNKQLSELANVIDVYVRAWGVLPDATGVDYPVDRNLDGYTRVGTVAEFVNTIEETTYGVLNESETAYLGIALKMQESAGNEYQGLDLGPFDIQVVAAQLASEPDSFGPDYDSAADYPYVSSSVAIPAAPAAPITVNTGKVKITLSEEMITNLPAEVTDISLAHTEAIVDTAANTITFESVELVDQNGEVVDLDGNATEGLTIVLPVDPSMNGETVVIYHDGVAMDVVEVANGQVVYTVAHLCEITLVKPTEEITKVETKEELAQALTEGGNYILCADLSVDADSTMTIAAGKTAVLDLAGRTVAGVSDQSTANRNMIDVRGTLTVKNGTMTIRHTGENMGWNCSTNVFNVTAGGVLNLANATVENLGGSDMAFGVHLNNWGEVTLNAQNTVFKSTYVGIRVFNSGHDMNNVTLDGCTVLTVGNCFWVHNYTAADFGGSAEKAAAADARLKLTFTNTTFARTSGSKSLIRFGFTNSIYYSSAAMNEVVAGTEAALNWALANGKNVLMNNDLAITAGLTVPAGKTIMLDLNGKTVSYTSTLQEGNSLLTNQGTLTIQNGTLTYEGVGDPNFGYGSNTITNSGKLIIDNATIINTTDGGSSNAIDNAPGSELEVRSGNIESKKVTIRLRDGSKATILDGTVTGARAIQVHLFQGTDADTVLTIKGGTFSGDYAFYSYAYGNVTFARTSVSIEGGTFNGIVAFGGGNKTATETVSVTGGTFNDYLGRYLANDGWEDIAKPQ